MTTRTRDTRRTVSIQFRPSDGLRRHITQAAAAAGVTASAWMREPVLAAADYNDTTRRPAPMRPRATPETPAGDRVTFTVSAAENAAIIRAAGGQKKVYAWVHGVIADAVEQATGYRDPEPELCGHPMRLGRTCGEPPGHTYDHRSGGPREIPKCGHPMSDGGKCGHPAGHADHHLSEEVYARRLEERRRKRADARKQAGQEG